MSIDISLRFSAYPFSANITGNLAPMASACGLYDALWHSSNLSASPFDTTTGKDLIRPLEAGLAQLHANEYADLEPANGWGNREVLLKVATDLLTACRLYPDAEVIGLGCGCGAAPGREVWEQGRAAGRAEVAVVLLDLIAQLRDSSDCNGVGVIATYTLIDNTEERLREVSGNE